MAKLKTLEEFMVEVTIPEQISRKQYLNTIPKNCYAIEISFDEDDFILEHTNLKSFKKSRNYYLFHLEQPHIPVKAHYHVYPPKSTNQELYAVNTDGTAHHRINKGYKIPNKEADELRNMGVNIGNDNIIESIQEVTTVEEQIFLEVNESLKSVFLIFEA